MVKICATLNCLNNSVSQSDLNWYPLPSETVLRGKWVELLGIKDSAVNALTTVCSVHFEPNDFLPDSPEKTLKPDVLPSLKLVKVVIPPPRPVPPPPRPTPPAKRINADVEIIELDDDTVVIPPPPKNSTKQYPSTSTPVTVSTTVKKSAPPPPPAVITSPDSRPSRRAARMAAEKIHKTVRDYGLDDDNEEENVDNPTFDPREHLASLRDPNPRRSIDFVRKTPVMSTAKPNIVNRTNTMNKTTTTFKTITPKTIAPKTTTNISTITPLKKKVVTLSATAKPAQKSTPGIEIIGVLRKPLLKIPFNLQMECVEEALSATQISVFKAAVQAYEKFDKKLEAAKKAKDTRIIYCTGNEIPPIQPPPPNLILNSTPNKPNNFTPAVAKPVVKPVAKPVVKPVAKPVTQTSNLISSPMVTNANMPAMIYTSPGMNPGTMHIIRPMQGQSTIMLAPNTPHGPASTYKVLVDPRTGMVVGTLPADSNILQPVVMPTKSSVASLLPPNSNLTITPIAPSEPQTKVVNQGDKKEMSVPNVVISEGGKSVTAQSLLSIRAITPLTVDAKIRKMQKIYLKEHLEKDKFSSEPLQWWLKLGMFDGEMTCRLCSREKLALVPNQLSADGYSWQCNRPDKCSFMAPVTRINFFSRFGASLAKLHRLIYHWAAQSDVLEAIHDSNVDIYMIRAVWRGIQDVCTRAVGLKGDKLGGNVGGTERVLELATVKIGKHVIICLMDRKTKLTRMKALAECYSWTVPFLIIKTIESWLTPKATVMTSEKKLSEISKKDTVYVYVEPAEVNTANYMSLLKVTTYLTNVLGQMFGEFNVSQLKLDTIQGFLDELQWRDRFGKAPKGAFWNIMKDIAEQSGKKVTIPVDPNTIQQQQQHNSMSVSLSSDSSSESESDSSQDASMHQQKNVPLVPQSKKPMPAGQAAKIKAKPSIIAKCEIVDTPTTSSAKIVRLSNFYYARKTPNVLLPSVPQDELNSSHFKCVVCQKTVDNNIKTMKHLMAHMESNRQRNPDLSDLTQCKYCFRDFETPYSMQCHIETVHLSSHDLSCKICNLACKDARQLVTHMTSHHMQSEMPYSCSICHFRSSFHREVIEHFHQSHNGTNHMLCHYCLKVYTIRFSSPSNVGMISNYYYHLYRHQFKSTHKKCSSCCLVFLNATALKAHKADHVSMAQHAGVTPIPCTAAKPIVITEPRVKPARSPAYQIDVPQKERNRKPKKAPLNAYSPPKRSKVSYGNSEITLTCKELMETNSLHCLECRGVIDMEHFAKTVNCGKCKFVTQCLKAFVEHMISAHSHITKKLDKAPPKMILLSEPMFCSCGFSTNNGHKLADHLAACYRRTCFPSLERAISGSVKIEPTDSDSIESGSAFFPPLVVLDENEVDEVNKTLSKIPETKQANIRIYNKRKADTMLESEGESSATTSAATDVTPAAPTVSEKPHSLMNALGLVRRRSDGENSSDAPPLLIREDVNSEKFEDRKGPSRNTRMARSAKTAHSNNQALNKEILDCMAELEAAEESAPPLLEPEMVQN